MTTPKYAPAYWLLLCLWIAPLGCADDPDSDATGDAGVIDDAQNSDENSDDAGDDANDTDGDDCPAPPEPTLGDTSTAAQWAIDASACGQEAFSIVDDPALGDLIAIDDQRIIRAAELEALAQQYDGLVLPRQLQYDTRVTTFSYQTQDRGELIEATSLVATPIVDDGDEFTPAAPMLSLHGTTGFTDQCAPSGMLEGQLLAALFAAMGQTVVAPDFIGLKSFGEPTGFLHPYLVGQATAIASLDALRTLYKARDDLGEGYCYPHEYVAFGGSQGGHAALWVDRLSATYAPEFEPLGTVATVPPADLSTQATKALQQAINATGNTIAFFATAAPWYGVADRLDEVFVEPLDELVPETLADSCSFGAITDDYERLDQVFEADFLAQAQEDQTLPEPWRCMIEQNGLVTTDIAREGNFAESYGVLFIVGEEDELVDTPIERDSFSTLCEQGMPLSFLECAGAAHGPTTAWAIPEFLDFLEARQQRLPVDAADQCQLRDPVVCQGTPQ